MTKVDIISGFLGAGKTTFIKQLINQVYAGQKLVLIENEFGEIGIDGGFLQDAGIEITEMNSGCICCTLVGDFSKALKKVIDEYHPDRVIIEPSGVGKLSDVVKAVEDVKADADIEICAKIAVVDGKKAKLYLKNFGEFFQDQVAHASTIVISRTQMMTDEKIEERVHLLRHENENATIISTPWDQLEGEAIRHALEHDELHMHHEHEHEHECGCGHDHGHHHHHDHGDECSCGCGHHHHEHDCGCGHHHDHHEHHHHDHGEECTCGCGHHHHDHDHHHHHHADEVFTSWGQETAHKYTAEELDAIVNALAESEAYGTVLRAKGIIAMADGSWKQFDLVPEEHEVRDGKPDYTGRVCVIGTDLKEDELLKLFHI
ncbi:MAG: GTP-binding protein [Tyzzerella sp.]|nr:GTP-binding protein [Tyzzerella sp.]